MQAISTTIASKDDSAMQADSSLHCVPFGMTGFFLKSVGRGIGGFAANTSPLLPL